MATPNSENPALPRVWSMTPRCDLWAKKQGNIDYTHESMVFEPDGPWEVPKLAPCLIWPERLFKYEGQIKRATRPGDCVHFYTHDYRMEPLWTKPRQYLASLQGVGACLTPDFSVHWEAPRAVHVFNVYRNRWLGAFFQAWGLNVIPAVRWCDVASMEYCFDGLPRGGLLSVSTQSVSDSQRRLSLLAGMRELVSMLDPAGFVVYGERITLPDMGVEVRYFPTHMDQVRARGSAPGGE